MRVLKGGTQPAIHHRGWVNSWGDVKSLREPNGLGRVGATSRTQTADLTVGPSLRIEISTFGQTEEFLARFFSNLGSERSFASVTP